MSTQVTNEMDFCFSNHKFITNYFFSNFKINNKVYSKFYEVFVLSISTRNAFPNMYAYK